MKPTGAPARQEQPKLPFGSAAEAWFWTMATLKARQTARPICADRVSASGIALTDEILRCLDTLYRHRRIDLLDARILRHWGDRGRSPDPNHPRERCDARIWQHAIGRLDWPLRVRGIVSDR